MDRKKDIIIPGSGYDIHGWIRWPEGDYLNKCQEGYRAIRKLPMAIFMHGACMGKNTMPLRALADSLLKNGIAVLSFDFFGHGETGGDLKDMTVQEWVRNAEAVLDYAGRLSFVSDLILAGHSQGGLVASLLAGKHPDRIKVMALYAPAAVIEEIGKSGVMPKGTFDPDHIPEELPFFGSIIKGDFYRQARELHTYETAKNYQGPVCILQGTEDELVPVSCAKKYYEIYQDAELHLLKGEDHLFKKSRYEAAGIVTAYMMGKLGGDSSEKGRVPSPDNKI